jgi:hypothetical protein
MDLTVNIIFYGLDELIVPTGWRIMKNYEDGEDSEES